MCIRDRLSSHHGGVIMGMVLSCVRMVSSGMCTIQARSGLRAHCHSRSLGRRLIFDGIQRRATNTRDFWVRTMCSKTLKPVTCLLKVAAVSISDDKFNLYTEPLPISKTKYDDLVSLTVHLSPEATEYYKSLPFDGAVSDSDANSDCSESSEACLLYTSPSPRDRTRSRMPSSA
eukprot:TRINITY_DN9922_c0_g1_i1.p1 TRINITY_DN9922_c0_g1~~TRINITY_DN9922_c0_g1_i1.p1  ORF type:complete len:174 (-),score=26.78 TRINITY_DN9922_c0_g1_i1:23-544(-)